jgi:transposase
LRSSLKRQWRPHRAPRQRSKVAAFKTIGLTWIVERSFAWLGRNRRLSEDYEYRVRTSVTMIDIATSRIMLNRLANVILKHFLSQS